MGVLQKSNEEPQLNTKVKKYPKRKKRQHPLPGAINGKQGNFEFIVPSIFKFFLKT